MSADNFALVGSYQTTPLDGVASFGPDISAPINESLSLGKKSVQDLDLTVDSPVSVAFGNLSSAHIVILKAIEGKVTAKFTSTDGAAQAIPFDTYLILMSMSAPITALTLTRTPALNTQVRVFLGQQA
jgi:hypothetical protein